MTTAKNVQDNARGAAAKSRRVQEVLGHTRGKKPSMELSFPCSFHVGIAQLHPGACLGRWRGRESA